jgi:hypothetical protein
VSSVSPAAPTATSTDAGRRARGRRMMALVFAVAAAPIVLGTLAYYFYPPAGRTNYGELVPLARADIAATTLDARAFDIASLRGKWVLIAFDRPACDERCQQKLYYMRQVRTAQGRDQDRVARVWFLRGDGTVDAGLHSLVVGATLARVAPEEDPARVFGAGFEQHVFLADTEGNLVLRFPADPDPKRMIRDLQKLLRVNNRGS